MKIKKIYYKILNIPGFFEDFNVIIYNQDKN